jgi:hypothetical protein
MTKTKNPVAYTAPHPVYVDGVYAKPGEVFVTADTPGDQWEKVTTAEKAAIEASAPLAGDPPIEGLSQPALEALAVTKHVNPTGLKGEKLKTAIKAADEPRL